MASPFTVARPTRSPVNEPGPTDTEAFQIGGSQPTVGEKAIDGRQQALRMRDGDVQRDLAEQAVTVQDRGPARQRRALDGEQLHGSQSLPRSLKAIFGIDNPEPPPSS